jgi:hypothetical protein
MEFIWARATIIQTSMTCGAGWANSTLFPVSKTILIAPFDGPLAAALAREARSAGWSVVIARPDRGQPQGGAANAPSRGKAAAPAPSQAGTAAPADAYPAGDGQGEGPAEGHGLTALTWNPPSFVSTSALFLAARNAVGELDAAVLISGAGSLRSDLVGSKPGEVEGMVLREALGPALFAREALRSFEARKAGALVLHDSDAEPGSTGPAAGLASGAFRGLGEGIFAASKEAAWEAFGVLDKGGNPDETARFILRLLDEKRGGKSGRWLRFAGKPGLFGMF